MVEEDEVDGPFQRKRINRGVEEVGDECRYSKTMRESCSGCGKECVPDTVMEEVPEEKSFDTTTVPFTDKLSDSRTSSAKSRKKEYIPARDGRTIPLHRTL
jgi:hypothetical protein